MVWRDAMPGRVEAFGVIADNVVAQTLVAPEARRDRAIVFRRELDRFLAADDRDPDRRARPLHRAWPQRDILVGPELALVGKHLLAPGAGDDVKSFLKASPRLGERHVVHLVFARNAAGKAGDQPPL